jgi:alkanesulfonate monooxygenase SsuD/methylene tetrahydromethanopterin reductase-like flavin-dependent oxidoreductase (luciferase family)
MPCVTPLRLAVALDGAGGEPSTGSWIELAQEAERGRLDFITFDDPRSVIAAQVAPLTSRIGLIPALGRAQAQSEQLATSIAALDQLSSGRAGWLADLANLADLADLADLANLAELVQAGPVLTMSALDPASYRFAVTVADVLFVTPLDPDDAREIVAQVRAEQADAGRPDGALRIFADLEVFLDQTEQAARDRLARRDDLALQNVLTGDRSGAAAVFAGTPSQLQARLQSWQRAGIEGFRLRPAELPHDLRAITRGLVPVLQENDAFRRGYEAKTLRALLGLPRAVDFTADFTRLGV